MERKFARKYGDKQSYLARMYLRLTSCMQKLLKPRQADNFRKYKMKQIPKMDILYSRYSRKDKKTTESVIFRRYSKDIVKPIDLI